MQAWSLKYVVVTIHSLHMGLLSLLWIIQTSACLSCEVHNILVALNEIAIAQGRSRCLLWACLGRVARDIAKVRQWDLDSLLRILFNQVIRTGSALIRHFPSCDHFLLHCTMFSRIDTLYKDHFRYSFSLSLVVFLSVACLLLGYAERRGLFATVAQLDHLCSTDMIGRGAIDDWLNRIAQWLTTHAWVLCQHEARCVLVDWGQVAALASILLLDSRELLAIRVAILGASRSVRILIRVGVGWCGAIVASHLIEVGANLVLRVR